jgi:hypothetical protein
MAETGKGKEGKADAKNLTDSKFKDRPSEKKPLDSL